MAVIVLASELDRLTPQEKAKVTWIIADDGTWTEEQIKAYIDAHFEGEVAFRPDDWTRK